MKILQQLLDSKCPIAHKTWPIGVHLSQSKHDQRWVKVPASYIDGLPESFDTEKAILEDDGGYFELPPVRPTYEELAKFLIVNQRVENLKTYYMGKLRKTPEKDRFVAWCDANLADTGITTEMAISGAEYGLENLSPKQIEAVYRSFNNELTDFESKKLWIETAMLDL